MGDFLGQLCAFVDSGARRAGLGRFGDVAVLDAGLGAV